jgi:hypothetical protein
MKKPTKDETIDRIVRGTLDGELRGELSPFFAARIANTAHMEARTRPGRPRSQAGSTLLTIYWLTLLASSILMVAQYAASGAGRVIVAVLVPVGFGLAAFGREILSSLLRRRP